LAESLKIIDIFQENLLYLSGYGGFLSFRFGCIMVNGQDVRLGKNTSELFEPLEE